MKDQQHLINKYNRPGPRYTSYPPVPFWSQGPDEEAWLSHIRTKYNQREGVDLYVHVPYCEKLCYYCGCNRSITTDHGVEASYLNLVLLEWEMYQQRLGLDLNVNSLHFGGGTPTFLSPENLRKLIERLTLKRSSGFIGSIEIDPRTCSPMHLKTLSETGISRVSLGIQDFDPRVQTAINRQQSVPMVEALMERLREHKFSSINFDLIYGLPKQNQESIASTIEIVARMRPDLIAFYGYAHLPERIKNQRLINPDDLPSAEMRRALYESGKSILSQSGYDDIGMDHFALPGSFLHEAKLEKKLHRNFMGYVDKKSTVLIGLGPTSISDSGMSFVQNAKDMKSYEEKLKNGVLPMTHGHSHSTDDLAVQQLILKLMCEGEVLFKEDEIPDWQAVKEELQGLQTDGILNLEKGHLTLSELGKPFLRNVAMCFDFHLRRQKSRTKFSQTI